MARIYLSPPHMGQDERELLLEAYDSNWIAPLGPHVDAFEREFAARVGVPHAAALSSGTAALRLPVPTNRSLLGAGLFAQWAVVDPGGAFGPGLAAFSGGLAFAIGDV